MRFNLDIILEFKKEPDVHFLPVAKKKRKEKQLMLKKTNAVTI